MKPDTKTKLGCERQSGKFKEAARELGVDLDEERLRETLRQVAPVKDKGAEDVQSDIDQQAS